MNITIKSADLHDIRKLSSTLLGDVDSHYPQFRFHFITSIFASDMKIYIAWLGDEIIGHLTCDYNHIVYLDINEGYRGIGIGKKMVDFWKQQTGNCCGVELTALDGTFGFWEKQGFVRVSSGHHFSYP